MHHPIGFDKRILRTEVQDFIWKNQRTDIVSLLLQKPVFQDISNRALAQQLEARKKCETKLPKWFGTKGIYYPNKLSIEQSSSEIAAKYKSQLVSGESLIDATGGFGVDSYYFSSQMAQIYHCEIDPRLSKIAAHNLKVLKAENIRTIPTDGIQFLRDSTSYFNWIYLDPSRRSVTEGRVFRLSDYRPNILEDLGLLFAKSDNILLKTSPLLDFSIGISELGAVKEIHVVAVKNEVKELLWILKKGYAGDMMVKTVNFSNRGTETFEYPLSEEKSTRVEYALPLSYIYEPNAAILKSGAFKTVSKRFHLKKLHEHTHLYTADELIDFPGRRFKVKVVLPYNKKQIKRLGLKKANISTRNFPESVAEIRKKFGIGDGGDTYLFFATLTNEVRTVLLCSKE
ncbi:class I SAM-dependent methyltransferase [Pricia sp. S334]|uniref:Class I SAM-dependent methyltransferase n=1 Tax=Pricia mediterranea TaxID=3076079 RepID=A0ABU3L8U6_9FLAO|nr:class I SAM-dependent methyltransferase [Pricia sp. S334]MDT7830165.1 class I SAM-dependent methyltransferase [Pricia sp. S334]